MYSVKLAKFEGPLDLLLELIESNRLDITEISLAELAEQYLDNLLKMQNAEINYLSDFLVVASRLILLKSKMLLPKFQISDEEEKDVFELKRHLELYQKFRKIAPDLAKILASPSIAVSRNSSLKVNFSPPKWLSPMILNEIFKDLSVDSNDAAVLPQGVLARSISIKEKIDFIKNSIVARVKSSFREMIKDSASKADVLVSFLAVLELLKNRFIYAKQEMPFSDIEISLNSKQKNE